MAARFSLTVVVAVLIAPLSVFADKDVDLIPKSVLDDRGASTQAVTPPPEARAKFRSAFFLEDASSAWSTPVNGVVPFPSQLNVAWQNRLSFDAVLTWRPWQPLALTLSDWPSIFAQDNLSIASPNWLRNALREAYVSWEPLYGRDAPGGLYLEAGRINVRHGVALGFNPTDFFKTRSLLNQASLDPSVMRQNRLGTLMARSQFVWNGGSASIAYAPKVAAPAPIIAANSIGVDPHFDATNAAHRVEATVSVDVLDLNPELIGYYEAGHAKLGLNLSYPIGSAIIAYAEWAGGPEQRVTARAIAFGKQTKALPNDALLLTDTSTRFLNDAAGGMSWTIASTATLNVEYHLHQGGFDAAEWREWFRLGSAPGLPPSIAGALWYVRAYANDQQEPMSQHQAFVRVAWPRAFVPELELTAFAFVNLIDGSVLTQLAAAYDASKHLTVSAFLSAGIGSERTERGSFSQRVNGILQVRCYF